MDVITAEWLKERLGDDRGKKAELALALGIGHDKVSKMLSGGRKPQAEEIPLILKFFKVDSDIEDPDLSELRNLWPKLTPQVRQFLRNSAKA